MVGLAVGIDYTLFILIALPHRAAPHRRPAGGRRPRGRHRRVAPSSSPGLTVLIALVRARRSCGIPFLTSMGLAAAGTVLMAVLVALTLLPAVLGMLKSKAFGGRVRRERVDRDADGLLLNNGVRWARLLGRAPGARSCCWCVVALGALALPARSLHLALPSDSTAAASTRSARPPT